MWVPDASKALFIWSKDFTSSLQRGLNSPISNASWEMLRRLPVARRVLLRSSYLPVGETFSARPDFNGLNSDLLSLLSAPALEMSAVPRSLTMKITKINMSLREATADEASKTYNMLMTRGSTSVKSDALLHVIQSDKDKIIRKRLMGTEATTRDTVWKENHSLSPYTEAKMIQRSEKKEKAVFCALNEPGMRHVPLHPSSSQNFSAWA